MSISVDFVDFQSILSILVNLVDLWPVDTKMGFERPCQSTLGCPIDFNGNLDLRLEHWLYGEIYLYKKHRSESLALALWRGLWQIQI